MASQNFPPGVVVLGPLSIGFDKILTYDALQFLAELHRNFNHERLYLLQARIKRQQELDAGKLPDFLPETASIREGDWKVNSIPKDLQDRRVEITGPVDRKMVINALNSGAKVFMADFEDATCPTWNTLIEGQINLRDAVNRTVSFEAKGKKYTLRPENELATLMVRPRGWHLPEAHVTVDGQEMSGSLFDFGLFFYHNAKNLIARGSGPYFYLPKIESHKEARLWNDVFIFAQKRLGIPVGTIRATVLIETLLAAFEMDEILYELRMHSAGLNCGRWDYIFSTIKKLRNHPQFVLPDRSQVTMTSPFMAAYVRLLIQTCHRRGIHAMGGMSNFIPVAGDEQKNKAAFEAVRQDKEREVRLGHDGTWVAHPALVPLAKAVFDQNMPTPNQISRDWSHLGKVTARDLLHIGDRKENESKITMSGLRNNLDVGLHYLEAWLRGLGCVPLHNLMEDAATAEIARCQIWQWIKFKCEAFDDETGSRIQITKQLVSTELAKIVMLEKQRLSSLDWEKRFPLASELFQQLLLSDQLCEFLTIVGYPYIVSIPQQTSTMSKL